ncbi:Prenylcysteine lyase-domain-containing protein [Trametes punicea]|nr:Prenylcysteine lyase-domain-containing protein [Trametes punicea]
MRSPTLLLVTTAAFFPVYAFQLPFSLKLPAFLSGSQAPLTAPQLPDTASPNRVAIIGAGAAGSSAAFWIAKGKARYGLDVEVDVYERSDYIGGRSTTVFPYGNDTLEPIELGASVFVKANKNLWRAVDEFGLLRIDSDDDDDDEDDNAMGLWDGQHFVLTTEGGSFLSNWLTKIKILWRYGYKAPSKTQALVKTMINRFVTLYSPSTPHWSNISSVVTALDWFQVVAETTSEYFDLQGIDRRWTRELVEAATRVNYGQVVIDNVDKIHALEGLVSLAPTGASSVKGGNCQIFEHFIANSNASVHLNTTVKSISHHRSGPWVVESTADDQPRLYRSVILAAPLHQTNINFKASIAPVPTLAYVHLHVTLLTTSSPTPNATYFNLGHGAKAPSTLLTTYEGVRTRGGPEPEFNSMTYHGLVRSRDGVPQKNAQGDQEWIVKIFSRDRIEDDWLDRMFEGKVGWVLRKEWDAYPVLPPTTEFPPVKLAEGLYYVNAFEPLISTMETETIASRNVVDLLLKEQFNAGLCKLSYTPGAQVAGAANSTNEDFVYGWDCPTVDD